MTIFIPAAAGVDLYVFAGTDLKDAVSRYNLFSGGGCLPPLYGLGVLYRCYYQSDEPQVEHLAEEIREGHMPCDIIGLEPGWQSKSYSCSYLWDKEKFSDPDQLIRFLRKNNFRINLWEQAFVNQKAPFYDEMFPYSGDYLVWEWLVPDFTKKEARDAFMRHHRGLLDKGIDGFKLDECDSSDYTGCWSFPNCTRFPSGMDGMQMHNQLGLLFQSIQEELFRSKNRRTWSQVRASYAFAASYPFVLYSDLYDQGDFLRALVNSGFCGLLWTPEVRQTDSAEELIRRLQMTILSPQACVNAWMIPNTPWRQYDYRKNLKNELLSPAECEKLTAACRNILNLRMSLIPYLYSSFWRYKSEGMPVFRALVMDYPDDPEAQKIDDQVMIGNCMLAAPVMVSQGNQRDIYLPAGNWFDFFTGEKYKGGKWLKNVQVDLEKIPLFIKENSILPLADPVEHVEENLPFEIELRVYGTEPCSTFLYEDDGVTYDYEDGKYSIIPFDFDGKSVIISFSAKNESRLYRFGEVKYIS